MKITKTGLKQIIKEEYTRLVNEITYEKEQELRREEERGKQRYPRMKITIPQADKEKGKLKGDIIRFIFDKIEDEGVQKQLSDMLIGLTFEKMTPEKMQSLQSALDSKNVEALKSALG